jgi:hypothetical protein
VLEEVLQHLPEVGIADALGVQEGSPGFGFEIEGGFQEWIDLPPTVPHGIPRCHRHISIESFGHRAI